MRSFRAAGNILVTTHHWDSFRSCGLCFFNLLAGTNNFGLGAILLSCLVSEQQKTFLLGMAFKTVFRGYGLCFCNLLTETKKFKLCAILLQSLVSETQCLHLRKSKTRHFLQSFDPRMFSSRYQGISMPILTNTGSFLLDL
jgi:hypothetical protein